MSDVACTKCGCPLSGGLDTYGQVGDEQCFDCFMTPDLSEDVDLLKAELSDARARLSDLEDEMGAVEDDVHRIEQELEALYRRQRRPTPTPPAQSERLAS
jgi:hypothetical protein